MTPAPATDPLKGIAQSNAEKFALRGIPSVELLAIEPDAKTGEASVNAMPLTSTSVSCFIVQYLFWRVNN